jgi:hypothetical protein
MARGSKLPVHSSGHLSVLRAPRPPKRSPADRLFAALDDRRIETAGSTGWVARVLGIHIAQGGAWVQIASANDATLSVVLHLSPQATGHHAMAALTAWSQLRQHERPALVEVMRLA